EESGERPNAPSSVRAGTTERLARAGGPNPWMARAEYSTPRRDTAATPEPRGRAPGIQGPAGAARERGRADGDNQGGGATSSRMPAAIAWSPWRAASPSGVDPTQISLHRSSAETSNARFATRSPTGGFGTTSLAARSGFPQIDTSSG